MVSKILNVYCQLAQSAKLAILRSVLEKVTGNAQNTFAEQVIESVFITNKSASFDTFIKLTSKNALSPTQRDLLFMHLCEMFDEEHIPESLIKAFERVSGGTTHYSQEGEDTILTRLWDRKKSGFFVDVGAHHARRFSNTYALYRQGWRGINIDATPGSMDSFSKLRPDDINLEIAISDKKEPLIFHIFREAALNTFDKKLATSYIENDWELQEKLELVPRSLADVLSEYLEPGQKIDLISIDVEGEDLGVLQSNDWNLYCPDVIIIEALDTPLVSLPEHPAVIFLKSKGFVPISRLYNSIILQQSTSICAVS